MLREEEGSAAVDEVALLQHTFDELLEAAGEEAKGQLLREGTTEGPVNSLYRGRIVPQGRHGSMNVANGDRLRTAVRQLVQLEVRHAGAISDDRVAIGRDGRRGRRSPDARGEGRGPVRRGRRGGAMRLLLLLLSVRPRLRNDNLVVLQQG